ncbi:MAG: hypothetical protein ACI4D7_06435, partial [Lachnospiraceae bacterium]
MDDRFAEQTKTGAVWLYPISADFICVQIHTFSVWIFLWNNLFEFVFTERIAMEQKDLFDY